jgi:hypothetical protein
MSIGRHKVAMLADSAGMKALLPLLILAALCELAAAQAVPLPRPRPAQAPQPAEASQPAEPAPPSACRLRLTDALAIAPSVDPLVGPGECGIEDAVRLEAVVLPNKTRVAVTPPAIVRCSFAEAIAYWVREDVAPAVRSLEAALRGIDNYAAYDCRGQNRIVGARLSEHGKGNALDMRSLKLASGPALGLTDPQVSKDFRERLRKSTCARFNTVLGPGSDGYHETHVHVDLAERRSGYRICHWEVREPGEEPAATAATAAVPLPRPRPTAAAKQ